MKRLCWKGIFEGNSGYINATRLYPSILLDMGLDVGIIPLRPIPKTNPMAKYVVKDTANTFSVFYQTPNISPSEECYFTAAEFNVAPPEWWESLEKAKLILAQSKYIRSIYAKIPNIDSDKIKVVNYPIGEEFTPEGEKASLKGKFIFGSVFDWVARKKPELMWQAFREEFPLKDYPDVTFINKIMLPGGMSNWKWWFNKYTEKDPRIYVTTENIKDMPSFYRSLNCYISPTAGEGWGQTLTEAMACGIPTIASNHGGNLDFMNKENSYLVDCDDWSYVGQDPINKLSLVHSFQKWRLPKVQSIRACMRMVYEGKGTDERVKKALEVKNQLSPEKIGEQLIRALEPML